MNILGKEHILVSFPLQKNVRPCRYRTFKLYHKELVTAVLTMCEMVREENMAVLTECHVI